MAGPQEAKAIRRVRLLKVLAVVAMGVIVAAFVFPMLAKGPWPRRARRESCHSNLRQVAIAALMFAQEHDSKLPDAHRWQQQLLPYLKSKKVYKCPTHESRSGVSYAMNPRFSAASLEDHDNPSELIVFYDADEHGRPDPRHNGGLNCVFMDGHVKWMKGVPDQISTAPRVPPLSKDDSLWEGDRRNGASGR